MLLNADLPIPAHINELETIIQYLLQLFKRNPNAKRKTDYLLKCII